MFDLFAAKSFFHPRLSISRGGRSKAARHLNALEDMLLDQPSNSGFVVLVEPGAGQDSLPVLQPLRLVPDIWCMACFTRDFVSSVAATVMFAPLLANLPERPKLLQLRLPETLLADASSRAPPLAS